MVWCSSGGAFDFYPRSPCGERRAGCSYVAGRQEISIHALLAESDDTSMPPTFIFSTFLSTLSLRRATSAVSLDPVNIYNFYPRSPCGERPHANRYYVGLHLISIHALLAESDYLMTCKCPKAYHFYPRSPCGERQCGHRRTWQNWDFYPRSPCGERPRRVLKCDNRAIISIHALLAESDGLDVTIIGRTWISIHALLAESDC